ncbi:MAG: glycosyltransferase family 2 protein [Candidatus Magasanikbacteria bacterium]|nr:glycosyltransferase family 2 protein [Candidatus Magasanikbacteria bacterium]
MSLPLISVIVPVYNEPGDFSFVYHSLRQQTYPNMEVIIVDDGSESVFSPPNIGLDNSRPMILVRQEHRGAAAARNTGFARARGAFLFFWDADVVARPDMIRRLYQSLTDTPAASYAYANFYFGNRRMPAGEFDAARLKLNNFFSTMSLIRREDFVGFDETLRRFQDWDLWLTMLKNGKVGVWVPEYLFTVIRRGRMSRWLPRVAYRRPWKWLPGIRRSVQDYENCRQIIRAKHGL